MEHFRALALLFWFRTQRERNAKAAHAFNTSEHALVRARSNILAQNARRRLRLMCAQVCVLNAIGAAVAVVRFPHGLKQLRQLQRRVRDRDNDDDDDD